MPIITVQFIEEVVATPEQKRQLIVELTNTFCDILGDVVRPFVYTIIQETPQGEWGIAGVPMPDLVYLTSEEHAAVIERSNELMRGAIAQMAAASASSNGQPANQQADDIWRGVADVVAAAPSEERIERNKAVIRRFHTAMNRKDTSTLYELVQPHFVNHLGSMGDQTGPMPLVDGLQTFYEAMPDLHVTEDYMVAQGDRVATRIRTSGTHQGTYMGVPPTGKTISFTGIVIYRLDENGRIVERWQDFDTVGMMQQIGVIPAMG